MILEAKFGDDPLVNTRKLTFNIHEEITDTLRVEWETYMRIIKLSLEKIGNHISHQSVKYGAILKTQTRNQYSKYTKQRD